MTSGLVSFTRHVLTIAHLTFAEARRRRIVQAAVICALAFLVVFSVALFFAHRDMLADPRTTFIERQGVLTALTVVSFFAANFLSVVFAVVLPVDTLSGEIDSGVIQTIASKPISRGEIVLGKWSGHLSMAVAYLLLISGGIVLAMRVVTGASPLNVHRAIPLMVLEVALLLTVSIAGGARLSTVANGIAAFGFYAVAFVGGLVEQIGVLAGVPSARTIGILVSLISPADAVWRLAAYQLQPEIVRGLGPSQLLVSSVPTPLMAWWAVGFTALTLLFAIRAFRGRAL
jgi:ABC-type transport system involved in multi-copper enzyme maturation permease subunit